jgi:hypothetical protein
VSKIFGRSIHQHGLLNNEIPLRRYFLFVGGALLALLFAADAVTPRQPTTESTNSGPRLPRIRIHSELKGPEAVVIDTSRPTIVPTHTAQEDAGKIIAPAAPHVAENVAQPVSPSPKQIDAKELSKAERKPQPHSKIARARSKRPPVSYAQRPDGGPFDSPWTFGPQDARIRESFAQLVPRQQRQGGGRREIAWARAEHARHPQFGWFDTGW